MMALQQKHTMALQDTTPDELLSLLTRRPQHIVKGMLQIAGPAKQSSNWRKSTSSLGRLDDLPLELLHATLALLDFKSLSHVSRTCIRGIEVVNSLPEHRDLMLHASDALAALAKTRSIRHHLAANIHLALLSANCRLCSRYSALLHLPTCERCCYHCLWTNQSLWLIPISMAKKCFLLSEAAAKTLPVLRSVPGKYHVRYPISRQRPIGLVCVGAAKELSIGYLTISTDVFDEDTMCRPYLMIPQLPTFPEDAWTRREITRPSADAPLQVTTSNDPLPEVETAWHHQKIDVLSLEQTRDYRSDVHEVIYNGLPAISKIAAFDWQVPSMERET
jgi:hypothetical protein